MADGGRVMKTIIIAAVCVGVATLSAFAGGSCSGCGDKGKDGGDKGKDAPKESLTILAEIAE